MKIAIVFVVVFAGCAFVQQATHRTTPEEAAARDREEQQAEAARARQAARARYPYLALLEDKARENCEPLGPKENKSKECQDAYEKYVAELQRVNSEIEASNQANRAAAMQWMMWTHNQVQQQRPAYYNTNCFSGGAWTNCTTTPH